MASPAGAGAAAGAEAEAETETRPAAGTQPPLCAGVDSEEPPEFRARPADQGSGGSTSTPEGRGTVERSAAANGISPLEQHSEDFFDAHRQDHTASKLPAFRFADVRDSLAVLGLGLLQNQHIVSSRAGPGPAVTAGVGSRTQVASLSAVGTSSTGTTAGIHLAHQAQQAHHPVHQQEAPQNTTLDPENSSQLPQGPCRASVSHPPESDEPPALLTPVTEADESQSSITTTSTVVIHADAAAPADPQTVPETDPEPDAEPVVACKQDNDHDRDQDNKPPDTPHSVTLLDRHSPRSRASTYETASTSAPFTPTGAGRPVIESSQADDAAAATATASVTPGHSTTSATVSYSPADTESPRFYTPATRPRARRANSSRLSTSAQLPLAVQAIKDIPSPDAATKQWTQSQRELVLSSGADCARPDDDEKIPRRQSVTTTSRPPSSYKPPPLGALTPGRVPPIRSFRSSGSRRSSLPDMNGSSSRYQDDGEDYRDFSQRERSLRALEGTQTPPDAEEDIAESENNTADIFMSIAREDSSSAVPRRRNDRVVEDDQDSRAPRAARSSRQRPVSTIYNTSSFQNPSSPPAPVSRRLSDQLIPASRARRVVDEAEQNGGRDNTYQSSVIGRPSLKLDSTRASSRISTLKPSPITPRTQSVLEHSSDRASIFARRPITNVVDGHSRSSSVRQPTGLSRSFNAVPLVSKNADSHHNTPGGHHEASESSNSTAAPSTVWDELDELKSRIHRLELTGQMPKTSGAAVSRTSDERPPTAGTGATTLSGSPKRAQTEVVSVASSQRASQREAQPILRSALAKTKPYVSSDVYDAIEAAASDALSLSKMMGPPGQAGPISSGASTIGGGGSNTVTDRQLRKKAESICRSLTELCLALTDQGTQQRSTSSSRPQTRGTSRHRDDDVPSSPPGMKVFTGRQSTGADEPLPSIEPYSSPRTTRLEKRATFNFTGMNTPAKIQSPRYASSVVGGDDTITGRKSSLVVARARRGLTEEPDDQGRKTALLRTRRANTEEPEEEESSHTRRSSLILAPRRVTTISRVSNIDEEPQPGSRAPSRAFTDLNSGLRIAVPSRDSTARRLQAQEPASATSIQGPRRLITSGLPTPGPYSSRMTTPTTPSSRRFLQVSRQPQDREDTGNNPGRLDEDRPQRYSISGQSTASIARGPSLHRKRHSGIPNISGTASNVGGYR